MKASLTLLFCLGLTISNAQDTDSLFNRLEAMTLNGYDFFSIEGATVTYVPMEGDFTPKGIAKTYKVLKLKATDITNSDSLLGRKNYVANEIFHNDIGYSTYKDHYFLQSGAHRLISMTFTSDHKLDPGLERQIVELAVSRKIPRELYQPELRNGFNFAGRRVKMDVDCRWTQPNSLQCPYNGQMNWSSYKNLETAQASIEKQFNHISLGKMGKVISDEQIDVIFEQQNVKARKLTFDVTGVRSAIVGMAGAKTLTIYMMIGNIRGKYVACVISHWNNDNLNEDGLPALAAEVMRFK